MYWPLNTASEDRRKHDESNRAESLWGKRGELRKGEPMRRRHRHTPAESPESKRGAQVVPNTG